MATNEILLFGNVDTGTNLLTQAEYFADSQRPNGNQPGIARAKLVNKALRQSSVMAAAFAKFTADRQPTNVTDGLTDDAMATLFLSALRSGAVFPTPAVLGNDNNVATTAYVRAELLQLGNAVYTSIFGAVKAFSGYQRLPSGVIVQFGQYTSVASGTTGALSFPLAFPTACALVIPSASNNSVAAAMSAAVVSPSQFTITSAYGTPQSTFVIAIGY